RLRHIDNQQHRTVEQPSQLGRAGAVILGRAAVEQAHDTLDNGNVGAVARSLEEGPQRVGWHEPGVEVAAWPPRGGGVVRGIDVVRAGFERLDGQAASAQGRDDGGSDRGFAYAASGSGDKNPGYFFDTFAASLLCCPFWKCAK